MSQELFAFWEYSSFPYVLGGEIIKFKDNGKVEVKGYTGYIFQPLLVLPLEQGKELHAKIEALRGEQYNEEIKFKNKFRQKVKDLLPDNVTQHIVIREPQ